jgi:hypothetical protein
MSLSANFGTEGGDNYRSFQGVAAWDAGVTACLAQVTARTRRVARLEGLRRCEICRPRRAGAADPGVNILTTAPRFQHNIAVPGSLTLL